jgi:hypothetical protein
MQYSGSTLCIVPLDFQETFDNISHSYPFMFLQTHGFITQIRRYVHEMYTKVTSSMKINGHTSSLIPIKCGIRQGCPLSMQLFMICLDPLLANLENVMTGVHTGRRPVNNTVLAYVDDVTLLVTSPQDIPKIRTAMELCGSIRHKD